MNTEPINISSGSTDWRAYALSNFPCFPFTLNKTTFASTEGFIQGIKFPLEDPRRQEAFDSWSKKAKQIGESAVREYVWWNNERIPYRSPLHHEFIEQAIIAKFRCNRGAQLALISTGDALLIHDVGPESPHTSLTSAEFCQILTEIRAQLRYQPFRPL